MGGHLKAPKGITWAANQEFELKVRFRAFAIALETACDVDMGVDISEDDPHDALQVFVVHCGHICVLHEGIHARHDVVELCVLHEYTQGTML